MSGSALLPLLREACAGFERVGIAVSGGGDSVAALVLAVEALGPERVAAVTVDHGLRPEAAAEAQGVARLCARLGVPHEVLRWVEGPAGGNLMDEARGARQALIADWARGRVDAVVLAHTLDDQAETVLMRLARGSGVDGLAAMETRRVAQGVTWLRPLLGVTRDALREALRARDLGWVEDPSNADPRFQRVRARQALELLAALGITAQGLADTAGRMRNAREALERQAQEALDRLVREDRGTCLLEPAVMLLPVEIRDRLFAHLLRDLSGAPYRPRLDDLHRLIAAGQGTLAGCLLRPEGQPEGQGWRLAREAQSVATLRCPAGATWDGRWQAVSPVGGEADSEQAEIAALGESGLARLSAQAREGLHPHWRETGLPRAILAGLPAIWRGETLLAAPLAMWPNGWQVIARRVAAISTIWAQSH